MTSGYSHNVNGTNVDLADAFSNFENQSVTDSIPSYVYGYTTRTLIYFSMNQFSTTSANVFNAKTGYMYNTKDLGDYFSPVIRMYSTSTWTSNGVNTSPGPLDYKNYYPNNAKYMHVLSWGGGGGGGSGGSRSDGAGDGGGGGGTGAVTIDCFIPINNNTSYAVTVGNGGSGGAVLNNNSTGNNGGNGGRSYIQISTGINYGVANGGNGGKGGLLDGGTVQAVSGGTKSSGYVTIGSTEYKFSMAGDSGTQNSGNSGGGGTSSVSLAGTANVFKSGTTNLTMYDSYNQTTTQSWINSQSASLGAGGNGGRGDVDAQGDHGSAGSNGFKGQVIIFFYFTEVPSNVIRN